jgi:hypothetical protein
MLYNNSDQIASNNGEFTRRELRQKIKVGSGHLFSTKIYMDHIDILLSKLVYSELVQRLFEKMTLFLMDPLMLWSIKTNNKQY